MVQTGELHLTVSDPVGTVARVLAVVDQAGGRVDAHEETGRGPGTAGSATLTVRVPAAQLEKTVQTLRGLGDVTSFTLQATDVTGTAEDLDARIDAARSSVARIHDLMSKATTTADLISTEQALSERQEPSSSSSPCRRLRRSDRTALDDAVSDAETILDLAQGRVAVRSLRSHWLLAIPP